MSTKINLVKSETLRKVAGAILVWIWDEQDRIISEAGKLVELKLKFHVLGRHSLMATRFKKPNGLSESPADYSHKWITLSKGLNWKFGLYSDTYLYKKFVSLSHDPTPEEIGKAAAILRTEMPSYFCAYDSARYVFVFQSAPIVATGRTEETFNSEEEALGYLKNKLMKEDSRAMARRRESIVWDVPDDDEISKTVQFMSIKKV